MGARAKCLTALALAWAALALAPDAKAQERGTRTQEAAAVDATRGRDLDETQKIRIRVRNDLVPAGGVVVSVVALTRPEQVLGMVNANGLGEWVVDSRLWAGGFRIIARGGQGGALISRRVDVTSQALVRWNVGTGLLRIERDGSDS